MVVELLENMESLITTGKQWRAGQFVDLDNESAEALIKKEKAKVPEGVPQPMRKTPKAPAAAKTK